jgi:hypothetical protein
LDDREVETLIHIDRFMSSTIEAICTQESRRTGSGG